MAAASFKQSVTFQDRLIAWANKVRVKADQLPAGPERDAILRKVSQADVAAHMNDWTSSPGLQPPR